jgi:hypothetical protein
MKSAAPIVQDRDNDGPPRWRIVNPSIACGARFHRAIWRREAHGSAETMSKRITSVDNMMTRA